MLWTLILSFTIGGWVNTGYIEDGTIPSSHSVVIPNLPSKEICVKTGADHVNKYRSGNYRYYVGVYTCVKQGKN